MTSSTSSTVPPVGNASPSTSDGAVVAVEGTRLIRISRSRPRVNFDLEVEPPSVPTKQQQSASDDSSAMASSTGQAVSGSGSSGDARRYHMQPRRSLLGKPINYRAHRRDVKYRRTQTKVYNFLERPKDYRSIAYHVLVFLMVFLCLLLSVFSTINQYEEIAGNILYYLELWMVVWFMAEFGARVWSAGCRSRYQQWRGRLQFVRRPLCVVDVVVISASVIILCIGSSGQVFATSALRGLRFFQILRMVRVDRRGGSWKLLGSVVWAHRQELFTTLYIGFLGLISSSFLMYLAEKEKNPTKFGTYADALWWGVITLCTVGYGDSVPTTWPGKLIAAFCALLGISFFALPAGILGSGFALKVQQQQRQKHLIRRKGPAAVLIQSLWRCYAADENSSSIATWKPYLRTCKPVVSTCQRFKHNASFMSRLSTRARKDPPPQSPGVALGGSSHAPLSPLNFRRAISSSRRGDHLTPTTPRSLSPVDCKTSSASSSSYGKLSATDSNNSLDFDRSVNRNRLGLNDCITAASANHSQHNSHNNKRITSFMTSNANEYKDLDDEDDQEGLTQLHEVHKRAIRAIRKVKYFVARRKFKEAFRPYDVKDVLEQYQAGNLDMLTRIKILQTKLDLILGKSGSKKADVYDSKISLASRIVKVERQVDDIESKLDTLIDMYKEDRDLRKQSTITASASSGNDRPVPVKTDDPTVTRRSSLAQSRNAADVTGSEPALPLNNNCDDVMADNAAPSSSSCRRSIALLTRNASDLGPRVVAATASLMTADKSDVIIESCCQVTDVLQNADNVNRRQSSVCRKQRLSSVLPVMRNDVIASSCYSGPLIRDELNDIVIT